MYNSILDDLNSEQPVVDWILPGFIPRQSLIVIGGVAGVGKSYMCYSIGLALAAGLPVLGHTPERPFRVVYFDQENSHPDRIEYERWAWRGLGHHRHLEHLLPAHFWVHPFYLGGSNWASNLESVVHEQKPDLFMIDTATPALNIKEENDNAEAARAINELRRCMAISQASCMVLKHANPEKSKAGYTLRGAKTWLGASDAVWYHIHGEGRPRKDGLANTILRSNKTRAFGLRGSLSIKPNDGRQIGHGIELVAAKLSDTPRIPKDTPHSK